MPRESDEETLGDNHQQNGHADGGEKGEKGNKQGGGPVGFWNPALKKVRNEVFKNWAITSKSSVCLAQHHLLKRDFIVVFVRGLC